MILDILVLVGFGTVVYYIARFIKSKFGKNKDN